MPQIDLVAFATVYFITALMFWVSYALKYTAVSYIFHWTPLFYYYSYSTYTRATLSVLAVMQNALIEEQTLIGNKKENPIETPKI